MWDVIVVGARCGGAATALRFARSGRSVLVLDKAPRGSNTLSTHILMAPALRQLESLGLLAKVRTLGAPPARQMFFEFPGGSSAQPVQEPPGQMLCVRRTVLDPILIEAAEAAGATVRHQVHVESLLWQDGRVVGVQGRDESGVSLQQRARLVVGADGRHSVMAGLVGAPEYNNIECPTGIFYTYYEGVGPSSAGSDTVHVAFGPQILSLCSPCDGGLHVILIVIPAEEFDGMRASDPEAFEGHLRTIPTVALRFKQARRAAKLFRVSPRDLRGYFRRPFGPGWALVGDAGACPHPAQGHGIADALRSAELLHQFTEAAWAAGQPAEAQLEQYQQMRDTENIGLYNLSYRLAQVDPWRDPQAAAFLSGQARPPMPGALPPLENSRQEPAST